MGKTSDIFKKIRDNKGTFHAKMGSIKDRNGTDLTEDIKRAIHPGMRNQVGLKKYHYEQS